MPFSAARSRGTTTSATTITRTTVSSRPARLEKIAARYADGKQYRLDGLSVEFPDWHFNVRPSNTEPLLRLNLEAVTPELMAERRDEVIGLIRA
jgi:phosphomannomutase